MNWLSYLRINEEWNPLKNIFENETFSVFSTMKLMNTFFRERDKITFGKERGDRLKISSKDEPSIINLLQDKVSKLSNFNPDKVNHFQNLYHNFLFQ